MSIRGWLAVVARRLVIDAHRRRVPLPVEELPEHVEPDISDTFDIDPALATAWSRLSPRHREVLHHRELVGLNYGEIAIVMDATVPTVETLLFRARAALKREYQRAGGRLLGCGLFLFGLDRHARGSGTSAETAAHIAGCTACAQSLDEINKIGLLLRGAAGSAHPVVASKQPRLLPWLHHALPRLHEHANGLAAPLTTLAAPLANGLVAASIVFAPAAHEMPTAAPPANHGLTTSVGIRPAPAHPKQPPPSIVVAPTPPVRSTPSPSSSDDGWWRWPSPRPTRHWQPQGGSQSNPWLLSPWFGATPPPSSPEPTPTPSSWWYQPR
jgi:hypothetical protein